ncbi:MAG TPA: hypothetical protein DCQ26_00690 [Marinilabiliales bacterium]|jgi:hypothetical protein|nr:MAG: hypothetical protein A2W95_17330 [Bacteroidetes bacterium GWA2_40_14]OFX74894.1 MAG: hypothetical protein A2W96_02090 [Bacteroidetes bacterium GWD2_40_43]OFX93437.1 MAG: hypothetical protein A2W97_15420 [Bacteroidetes bacterium GWE2_40_63]OFY18450.1 MAG: hypothetical protein A2W88_19340 [Bacteroidetes bacterium GWF2_40_13]OFZ26423.1 MAG: hypothetical protein A2437_07970 [Bacteroidetes bacterium RIFOXYC2_FULL_40_12]HAM97105.1 hypothetical protein [Marinilabiliales bacterium]
MKTFYTLIILASILGLYSCERGFLNELFGDDRDYKLSNDYKIIFENKDTLIFESYKNRDVLIVDSVINGQYFESITGTCGKKPFDIFEFQCVYVKRMTDTIKYYTSDTLDDCDGTPFNNRNCITYVKGLVDTYADDGVNVDSKINWYDALEIKVSQYSNYYTNKKIINNTFDKVYEFKLNNDNNKDSITTLYYTDKYGFVGYIKNIGEIYELKK